MMKRLKRCLIPSLLAGVLIGLGTSPVVPSAAARELVRCRVLVGYSEYQVGNCTYSGYIASCVIRRLPDQPEAVADCQVVTCDDNNGSYSVEINCTYL